MRKTVIRSHATPMLSHPPVIPFSACSHSYFIHQGTVYNVASAPSVIFKAWIADLPPVWPYGSGDDAMALLKSTELDLCSRWWLLCLLGKARTPLKLYASKEMAEKVMAVSV